MNILTRTLAGSAIIFMSLSIQSPSLLADSPHGMMRNMDDQSAQDMMNERGYGYGMGYGMGGYGMGYGGGYGFHGRGQGYMMGPGNMMGPAGGMMGPMGDMMGPMGGMMGNLYGLNLDDKQRDKIRGILHSMRKQHFDLMEKMMETSDKLYDLYDVDKPDPDKIGKVYDDLFKIKRQMIQEHIQIKNKIYDLLNKEQREEFKNNDPFAHRFGMMMQ